MFAIKIICLSLFCLVEEALFDSKKSSVRVGGPVSSASSGELENVVSHLRSAPLPSPRKTLIKTPTPISPLPTSLRKASIFPQPTQPPAAANKPKEIKGTQASHGMHTLAPSAISTIQPFFVPS